jgi:transcriptional regulator with XRE-family HTH domain
MTGQTFAPNRSEVARCCRGLTRWALANELGVTVATIRRWERGITTPTPEQVGKLSLFLKFPLAYFYGPDFEENMDEMRGSCFIC